MYVNEFCYYVSLVFILNAALTKDVDLTITNILEGRVQFVAEEPSSPTATSNPSSTASSPRASSSVRIALNNYTYPK